jgi:hypothetical protein
MNVTHKKLKEQLIYTKLEEIEQELKLGFISKELERRINSINKRTMRIVTTAENECSSRHHESEWSIELHQYLILSWYWLTVKKGMTSRYQTALTCKELYHQLTKEQQVVVKHSLQNVTEEQFPGS